MSEQSRWQYFSLLLASLVVVVLVAALQEHRAEDGSGEIVRPGWYGGGSRPREMPTLNAYTDGDEEDGSWGGGQGSRSRSGRSVDSAWERAGEASGSEGLPNMELANSLEKEWSLLHGEGEKMEERAQNRISGARLDSTGARETLKRAAAMKLAAKHMLSKGQADERMLARREQPVVQLEARVQEASRAYRADMLKLATLVPEEAQMRQEGEAIPASLAEKVQEIDRRLRRDMKQRDMYSQQLASSSANRVVHHEGDQHGVAAQGEGEGGVATKGIKALAMQNSAYRQDEEADAQIHAAYKSIGTDMRIEEAEQRKVEAAQKVLKKAECIRKYREHFRFDEEEIPRRDVRSTYSTILASCDV